MLLGLTELILKILILLTKKYKVKSKNFDKINIGIEEYKVKIFIKILKRYKVIYNQSDK